MNNVRGLYPPLYGATASGGGGGGGQHIQVDALPEASLQYKDKIVQYVGATTETLTNGYFYKCVEHTTTEGETITVTYSWDNISVNSKVKYNNEETVTVHYTIDNLNISTSDVVIIDEHFATSNIEKKIVNVKGLLYTKEDVGNNGFTIPIQCAGDPTRLSCLLVVNADGELRLLITTVGSSYIVRKIDIEVEYYE